MEFATSRPFTCMVTDPTPAMSSAANAMPNTTAAIRWPLIVSTRESEESTPTIMRTNRKSIMTAPV